MNQIILNGVSLEGLLSKIEQLIDAKIGVLPTNAKEQSSFLSRKEVARLLKVTLPTLHDYTRQGWLKAYKIGTRVLYKEVEVMQSLEKLSSLKYKKGGFSHA